MKLDGVNIVICCELKSMSNGRSIPRHHLPETMKMQGQKWACSVPKNQLALHLEFEQFRSLNIVSNNRKSGVT